MTQGEGGDMSVAAGLLESSIDAPHIAFVSQWRLDTGDGNRETRWMILYNLRCGQDHEFEAWFKDGGTYDRQAGDGVISCPLCGDSRIGKAPMAPRIAKHRGRSEKRERAEAVETAPQPGHEIDHSAASDSLHTMGRDARLRETIARAHAELRAARRHIEENCEYVGDRFADEARLVHHGEAEERGIYGEATAAEAADLKEEGIPFARIPWLPRRDS